MTSTITYKTINSVSNAVSYSTTGITVYYDYEQSGFALGGWATSMAKAIAGTIAYTQGQSIVVTDGTNLTLYAVWQPVNAGQLVAVNPDGTKTDISDLMTDIAVCYGKNQPFSFVTFNILKNLFTDVSTGGYWYTRWQVIGYGQGTAPTAVPVDMVQKSTKFTVNVFGITGTWTYERVEDNGNSLYKVTAVCQAYAMKTTTLLSMLNFTYASSALTFTNLGITATHSGTATFSVSTTFGTIEFITDSDTAPTTILYVQASGSALFYFISQNVGGYSANNTVVDTGFVYDYTIGGTYTAVQDTYTIAQIQTAKTVFLSPSSCNANIVCIRPDEYCWDIINGIGLLTNREAFFYDKAYFVSYLNSSLVSNEGSLDINWGNSDPAIINLSTNDDQGSQYVLRSQKVISEAYEATVAISNTQGTEVGKDIKFMYPEKVTNSSGTFTFSNDIRNAQTKMVAFNTLVKWYEPGDCVRFSVSESVQVSYPYTAETVSGLPTSNVPTGSLGLVTGASFFDMVYTFNGTAWVNPVYPSIANVSRVPLYADYSIATSVKDEQNNITLTNSPLAYVEITYPSCITSYTWGEPKFMDSETQVSSIEGTTQDSTLDNTSDTQISNNYAAKIVVGNKSLTDLTDDRSGFTGLILEKNWDADLYRLAGYNNGAIEAQFDTQGQISAGAGAVILNARGLSTYNSSGVLQCMVGTNGEFGTGFKTINSVLTPTVILNKTGLTIYGNTSVIMRDDGTTSGSTYGTYMGALGAGYGVGSYEGGVELSSYGSMLLTAGSGSAFADVTFLMESSGFGGAQTVTIEPTMSSVSTLTMYVKGGLYLGSDLGNATITPLSGDYIYIVGSLDVSTFTHLEGALAVDGASTLARLSVSGTTALNGTSTAVTPGSTDNSTNIANTAWVRQYVGNTFSGCKVWKTQHVVSTVLGTSGWFLSNTTFLTANVNTWFGGAISPGDTFMIVINDSAASPATAFTGLISFYYPSQSNTGVMVAEYQYDSAHNTGMGYRIRTIFTYNVSSVTMGAYTQYSAVSSDGNTNWINYDTNFYLHRVDKLITL